MSCRVRIPHITNIKTAIELYYSRLTFSNADIEALFGKHSNDTVSKLKKLAQEKMVEDKEEVLNASRVSTKAAYEAWGLDIKDLEYRHKKLKQLEMEGRA